jgi:hypothetical protein
LFQGTARRGRQGWPSRLAHLWLGISRPRLDGPEHGATLTQRAAADDIARLTKGEFYFSTDGFNRPVKVRTPLCLSWHPPNPPTAEEVVHASSEKHE